MSKFQKKKKFDALEVIGYILSRDDFSSLGIQTVENEGNGFYIFSLHICIFFFLKSNLALRKSSIENNIS